MRFVATETAFVDNRIIEKGTEFEHPRRPGDWAVPVDEYKPEEPQIVEEDPPPDTFAGMQARRGRPLGSKNRPKE